MGQYHKVYNVTKKEFIHGHSINNSLKLMDQVGWGKSTSSALFLLLANSNGRGGGDATPHPYIGRWAGDKIVVQGDYADSLDPGYLSKRVIGKYTDISEGAMDMLNANFEDEPS